MFWTKMILLAIALWASFQAAHWVMEKSSRGSLPAWMTLSMAFILEIFFALWYLIEYLLENLANIS